MPPYVGTLDGHQLLYQNEFDLSTLSDNFFEKYYRGAIPVGQMNPKG